MAKVNTRKRGNKWQYQFEAASINGTRKQISKSGFKTKKEALSAGIKALDEYNNCGLTFTPNEISFSDYLDFWIKEYAEINLKDTSIENYKKKIKIHIKPNLGIYKLKNLSPAILQSFINKKFNEGYSRNTLLVLKGILSGSLRYAVEPLQYIKYNPMNSVKLPLKRAIPKIPTRKNEREIVTTEQFNKIIERFPYGTPAYLPLQLAYRCGLRLGEAFAITWSDIDFSKKTLTINKQVQWQNNFWQFNPPKYDSTRIIDLDNIMLDILKKYKTQQKKDKLYYGNRYTTLKINSKKQINTEDGEDIDLINIRENGTYAHPRIMQHCFRVIHYKLNYPNIDYHTLRHTHATMLLSSGVNVKVIQERLGHKKLDITLDVYSHVTDSMRNESLKIINTSLK